MINKPYEASRRKYLSWMAPSLAALAALMMSGIGQAGDLPPEDVGTMAAATEVGAWSPVKTGKAVAVHIALLPSGDIATWQDAGTSKSKPESGNTLAFLISMAPGKLPEATDWTPIPNTTTDLFCAGQVLLPDGRVFAVGGQSGGYYFGVNSATVFDPVTRSWFVPPLNAMRYPRWYPSVITLPDGEILVLSGTKQGAGDANLIPEVWKSGIGGWRELTGATAQLYTYPWLSIDPSSGKVYMAGPQGSRFLDTRDLGKLTAGPPRNFALRKAGTFAVYGSGKILAVGGGDDNTFRTAEYIDLLATKPKWTQTGSMANGRRYATATTLPDGTVLVTGGGKDQIGPTGVLPAELWRPSTGTWSDMAPMAEPRLYHSIALLLPDGRVLVGGGGRKPKAVDHADLEFFSPPYLFRGPQPTIVGAPARVTYGQAFVVQTPDAAGIANVNLIRLGALTHSVNASQVFYRAGFSLGSGYLNVTAPPNSNYAPPGFYMMFLLNRLGVPSVAKILQIL
jgi:galactose oxidase